MVIITNIHEDGMGNELIQTNIETQKSLSKLLSLKWVSIATSILERRLAAF